MNTRFQRQHTNYSRGNNAMNDDQNPKDSSHDSSSSQSSDDDKFNKLKWTRIISISKFEPANLQVYSIQDDLIDMKKRMKKVKLKKSHRSIIKWEPKAFNEKHAPLFTNDYILSKYKLNKIAVDVSTMRDQISQKAYQERVQEAGHGNEIDQFDNSVFKKLYRYKITGEQKLKKEMVDSIQSDEFLPKNRIKRKCCNLEQQEKVDIIYKVLVNLESHQEVAKQYNIKQAVISRLLNKARQNNNFISEIISKSDLQRESEDMIVDSVKEIWKDKNQVWSSNQVKRYIQDNKNQTVSKYNIIKVLKEILNQQFKPIQRLAVQANSQRCLVLRQQSAIIQLQLLAQGKKIYTIDETWVSDTDYRRYKWGTKGQSNSLPGVKVNPRVTVITVVDQNGEVFMSCSQSNTDTKFFSLFILHLVDLLDKRDKHWRRDSYFMTDNAGYHVSNKTVDLLEKLKVPTIFLGPYSFDCSICEYFFSYFKSEDINPFGLKTGKRVRILLLI